MFLALGYEVLEVLQNSLYFYLFLSAPGTRPCSLPCQKGFSINVTDHPARG